MAAWLLGCATGSMFALGQKQTFAVQKVMSALPPISDISLTYRLKADKAKASGGAGKFGRVEP